MEYCAHGCLSLAALVFCGFLSSLHWKPARSEREYRYLGCSPQLAKVLLAMLVYGLLLVNNLPFTLCAFPKVYCIQCTLKHLKIYIIFGVFCR